MQPKNKRPHRVVGLARETDVRHVVFFDTETFPTPTTSAKNGRKRVIQQLYLGWMCYRCFENNKVVYSADKEFSTVTQFWDNLEALTFGKDEILVMAFNVGFDADIVGIREIPYKRGWEINSPEINQGVYVWGMSFQGQKFRFLDLGNFIGGNTNLKVIGDAVGLEKLDVSFKGGKTVKDYPRSQVSEYCYRDVEIVEAYFLKWLEFLTEHNYGAFKNTLASQAMTAFRHKFPEIASTIVSHGRSDLAEFEHQAYHGGWNELYFKGHVDHVYAFDVNSFHPSIMKTHKLPFRLVEHDFDHDGDSAVFIIDADIYCPERLIPVKKPGVGLVFQIGKFRAQFSSIELNRLIEIGGFVIHEYKRQYYDTCILFDEYISELHGLKQFYSHPRIDVFRNMCKYMMNSLEGKWIQQTDNSVFLGETDEIGSYYELDSSGKSRYVKCFAGMKFTIDGTHEGHYNFGAISIFIRAHTRVHLSKWMQAIRNAGGKVYYHDTDSLHVDIIGKKVLEGLGLVGDELGQLQLEKQGEAEYRNLKDYTIDGKDFRKGIKKDAKKIKGGFSQDRFMRSAGMNALGIGTGVIITLDVPIISKNKTNKGVPQPDGWIKPFEVGMEPETKQTTL